MFDQLTALGYGIIVFAVIIILGVVVLLRFGTAMLQCPTTPAGTTWIRNGNVNCQNSSNTSITTALVDPTTTNKTAGYLVGQLGSGGLAGWTPAVIALAIGVLFLGLFLSGGLGRSMRQY